MDGFQKQATSLVFSFFSFARFAFRLGVVVVVIFLSSFFNSSHIDTLHSLPSLSFLEEDSFCPCIVEKYQSSCLSLSPNIERSDNGEG